jgi:hypothetical protein
MRLKTGVADHVVGDVSRRPLVAPGVFAALAFEHADTSSGIRIEYLPHRVAGTCDLLASLCLLMAAEKVHGSPLPGETLSYKVNTCLRCKN